MDSTNGMLFDYLRQHKGTGYSTRDRILKSLSAYWLPFAGEWAGKDEEELKSLARSSINQLELHIQYLRENFGLPQPMLAYLPRERDNSVQAESESEEIIDYSAQQEDFLKYF